MCNSVHGVHSILNNQSHCDELFTAIVLVVAVLASDWTHTTLPEWTRWGAFLWRPRSRSWCWKRWKRYEAKNEGRKDDGNGYVVLVRVSAACYGNQGKCSCGWGERDGIHREKKVRKIYFFFLSIRDETSQNLGSKANSISCDISNCVSSGDQCLLSAIIAEKQNFMFHHWHLILRRSKHVLQTV